MDVLNGGSLIMGGIPDPLSVNQIQAKSGPLKIGSATSGHGLTATNDLLIAGKLEVDGAAYFDGTVNATYFQYNSSNYFYAGNNEMHIKAGGVNGLIQDANLFDVKINMAARGNITMDAQKYIRIGIYADAQRPAAGTAGRVIYNSTDGNLNIDDGTNWILPDGTVT